MAENIKQCTEVAPNPENEPKPNFVTKLAVKYPRTSKVVAIIGGITAVAGVTITANTVYKNRRHVLEAGGHAEEALRELATAVSPTDTEA